MKTFIILISLLLVASCATISDSNLYWGNYSQTLYAYKKTPSKENTVKHKTELLRIIDKSKKLHLRPPPGVQAELGMLYTKTSELKKASFFFLEEQRVYPESKKLMKKLLRTLKTKKGKI